MMNCSSPTLHPLLIDPSNLGEIHQILPFTPTLVSESRHDPGLLMLHYQQCPKHELPDYTTLHHVLPVWVNTNQARFEAKLDDRNHWTGGFKEGSIGILPAGVHHKAVWDRTLDITAIFLHPKFVEQVGAELVKGNTIEVIPKHEAEDPVLSQLGVLLGADLVAGQPSGKLYRDSLATALAARLVSHHSVCPIRSKSSVSGLSKEHLDRIISYTQDYLDQEIRLADFAQLVGLSEYYLCRAFKQSMGIPLHQYVIQQRVERAKYLLRNRDWSIATVAQECGFSSHSHLTKHCKRLLGVSPKALRS
jgi:AraC family transcriptional regulator